MIDVIIGSVVGFVIGSFFGILCMALFCANGRDGDYEEENIH